MLSVGDLLEPLRLAALAGCEETFWKLSQTVRDWLDEEPWGYWRAAVRRSWWQSWQIFHAVRRGDMQAVPMPLAA